MLLRLNRGFVLRGVLRIQVSVQILIPLIFYSAQFILLIFHSCMHLQSASVCLCLLWLLWLHSFTGVWLCDLSSFPETEVQVCLFFIILGLSLISLLDSLSVVLSIISTSPKCFNGNDAQAGDQCSVWGLSGCSGCLKDSKMTSKHWRGHRRGFSVCWGWAWGGLGPIALWAVGISQD